MENKKIWLSSPHMGENEFKYVTEAFDLNWIAPVGPHLNKFEEKLSEISEGKDIAAVSSGTSAIHLALILLGIQKGDEVICSSFTFSASANPIVYQGATPIFVDSELETWNMCPEFLKLSIKDRIEKGKKPKAIILVHLYGMPAKMNEILDIANKYEIPIIEDAAEGLGSTYFGKPLGCISDFGIYSGFWELIYITCHKKTIEMAQELLDTNTKVWTNTYSLSMLLPWNFSMNVSSMSE